MASPPRRQGAGPDGETHAAVADLGGSIVTGVDGNPLAVLARQLGAPMHGIEADDVPLYQPDGSEAALDIDAQVRAPAGAAFFSFFFRGWPALGAGGAAGPRVAGLAHRPGRLLSPAAPQAFAGAPQTRPRHSPPHTHFSRSTPA
jgi:hypothetical protein